MNIHKINDHAYGVVYQITQDRPVSGGKPHNMHSAANPRTRSMAATSDCKVIRADGTEYTIPKYTRREPSADTLKAREAARNLRIRNKRMAAQNRKVDIQNALDRGKTYTYDARFVPIGDID